MQLPNEKLLKSFDFSPNSNYLYFTERNHSMLGPVDKIKRHLINNFTGNVTILATATGEVRRSKNGNVYVTQNNTQNQYIITNPDAGSPTATNTQTMADANWKYATAMMNQPVCIYTQDENLFTRKVNNKEYELTDHLGNVRLVFNDVKEYSDTVGGPNSFTVNETNINNYMPFGFPTPGRNYFGANTYRFGFNGKENDNEMYGSTGTFQDYGMRGLDTRTCRFISPDPLIVKEKKYPELSTYQFASNTPIQAIDKDGLEEHHYTLKYNISTKPAIPIVKYHHTNYYESGGILEKDKKLIPAGESWYILHYEGETWKYDSKEEMMKNHANGPSRELWLIKLESIAIDVGHSGNAKGFEQAATPVSAVLPENKSGAVEPPNNVPGEPYKMYPNGIIPEKSSSRDKNDKKQETIEQKNEKRNGKVDI